MNDFRDLLDHASRPDQDWLADSHALLVEGRRRVRRRRVRAGAAACAVVLTVVGLGLGRGHLGPDRPQVATPTSYADLDLTPLSVQEVEARCASPLRHNDVTGGYSFSVDTPHQPPQPWHVGSTLLAIPDDDPTPTACTVPESTAPLTPLTATDDATQLPRICGGNLGIDLSGWQTLAADADGGVEVGLFRSGNGYVADCHAESTELMGVQGDSELLPAGDWHGYAACVPTATGGTHCLGAGRVGDHSATRVAVTLPGGRVVERPSVGGYWAVAVRYDATTWDAGSQEHTFPARPVS